MSALYLEFLRKSFGNKIEINRTINADTWARNPHLLKTEVVLCDLKQN